MQAFFSTERSSSQDKKAALNVSMTVSTTECESLYPIKGEDRLLGYAMPGDLFLELSKIESDEDFDAALVELNKYYERKCWLMTEEGNEDHIALAQRAEFFWIYHGVWYRSNFND